MRWLKRIFDFYLDASVHVALAVVGLMQVTVYFLDVEANAHLLYFVFFSTIACYNFVKYGVEAEKYILVANRYHKNIQFASFIALGIAAYHAYFFSWDVWIAFAVLMGLTALYALPVLPSAKNLRSLGGFKIFPVALVWAGTTVILPVIAVEEALSWDVWIECTQRFVLVLILMIPFEIRDLKYDAAALKTIPQRYGVSTTLVIGGIAALIFFLLSFLKDHLAPVEIWAKAALFAVLCVLMLVTKKEQSTYFSSFWIEGIPILWWGLVWYLEG
ncbi:hypothetical protein WIW50_14130 [Flavobacteriaceae bacterium 3-367]|uniref:hypothetical protein n=1 Tax=Eudoraea algarum TaxID=3417568 RepID=UPI0032726C61